MWSQFLADIASFGTLVYANFSRFTDNLTQSVAEAILDPAAPSWVVEIVNSSGLGNITVFSLILGTGISLVVSVALARWLLSPLR